MPRWIHLFLDTPAERWEASVEFWAEATGCAVSPPRGENGQFVTLQPHNGHSWLKLQAIAERAPRVHLDLDADDRVLAAEESVRLGASNAWKYHDVAVMRSPGGLLFCHTLIDQDETPRMDRAGLESVADQVCLDIPAHQWDSEIEFWRLLTGRTIQSGLRPEFAFLGDPDPGGPPRILLQRLDDDAAAVTAHLDFAVRDRQERVDRHEQLGAQRVEDFERWTVMRAPSGHIYCLTDRDPATGRVRTRSPRVP